VQPNALQFTDDGHTLEFICLPGRVFHLITDWDDDDDDEELEPSPSPEGELVS